MNRIIKRFIYLLVFSFILFSCQDNSLYIEPIADFEIIDDVTNLQLFDTISFRITGQGNRLTFYTGDANRDFYNGDVGTIVKKGDVFKYIYTSPGIFKVSVVATGFEVNGEDFTKDVKSKDVTISAGGDVGKITHITFRASNDAEVKYYKDSISTMPSNGSLKGTQVSSIVDISDIGGTIKNCLVKTIYPNRIWPDAIWFGDVIPKKFKYSFNISTNTDISAIISLDDINKNGVKSFYYDRVTKKDTLLVKLGKFAEFKFNEQVDYGNPRYDMYEPILLKSTLGTSDSIYYNVYMMAYPEMSKFSIGGVIKDGSKHDQIRFNPQQFDKFYSMINLPTGTDITSLVPEFETIYPEFVQVKDVNGNILKGDGTDAAMDFSRPVTFTLIFTDPTFPEGFNQIEAYYTVYSRVL